MRFVRTLLAILVCSCFVGASCGQSLLSILPGVVNNPGNLTLRREILAFGIAHMCSEVQKRSVPLKLRPEDPSVGRFYATTCFSQQLQNGNLFVQFGGFGYVWTNLSQRMTFDAGGAVEYDTDFLLDGSTMYVYFREKSTSAATFTTKVVEQPGAASVSGLPLGPNGQGLANTFGQQILQNEIARGFTVIRDNDGSVQFAIGVIEKGQRPAQTSPYKVTDGGHVLLANERVEIHQNQRDYLGPLEVLDGKTLSIALAVDGAPGIDALVVPRAIGEAWLKTYTTQAQTTPPPAMPVMDEAVFSGAIWRRKLTLPEGLYYLVLDNTATAGKTAPTSFARDDRAAAVSVGVELE